MKRCQTPRCQSKATNGFDYCVSCATELLKEQLSEGMKEPRCLDYPNCEHTTQEECGKNHGNCDHEADYCEDEDNYYYFPMSRYAPQ